jgi:hypothetical protein
MLHSAHSAFAWVIEIFEWDNGIRTRDTAVKSDNVEHFRSYLVREEIDVKLDGAL